MGGGGERGSNWPKSVLHLEFDSSNRKLRTLKDGGRGGEGVLAHAPFSKEKLLFKSLEISSMPICHLTTVFLHII